MDNTKVKDFTCLQCESTYQLKATSGKFRGTVNNSAYVSKIEAIEAGNVPNYAFLRYSSTNWYVTDLFVVPGHFFTRGIILPRNPLSAGARRSGWIGSSILLSKIPPEGRITIVSERTVRPVDSVREDWRKFEFLRSDRRATGGWGAEVFTRAKLLARDSIDSEFTLSEFNRRFLTELSSLHPENHHVAAKIRQQMQVLRDGGLLEFLNNRGQYRILA